MKADRSLKRALALQQNFIPPYCPRPECEYHTSSKAQCLEKTWYYRIGQLVTKTFPYRNPRYRCQHCQKSFCYSFFKLQYRERIYGLNAWIFQLNVAGASNREIARIVGTSEHLVRSRLSKMARWGLMIQAQLLQEQNLQEPIVYDGLENFSYSQYEPNNIQHAIGKHSGFTYDFNFAPFNRKGRMSPRQKEIKELLEKKYGPYPKDILRTTTKRILQRLYEKSPGPLILYSDEHFQYRRAIEQDLKKSCEIVHLTTSSKCTRNYNNPLFVVNNYDMQIRQKSAAFSRETISFAKHSMGMVEKFTLFMVFKNFMRPYFYKKQVRDPIAHLQSPAQRAGLSKKVLKFHEFFSQRVLITQVKLNEDWQSFVKRIDPLSRRKIVPYTGA